jgi:arginyl-tRNA synthetase
LHKKFGVSTKVVFAVSVDEGRGDLTTSIALQLSKQLKKKPQELAAEIASALEKVPGVTSAGVAGAGYVNITVDPASLLQGLSSVTASCSPSPSNTEPPIIVEYSQPNIAKPLGIHHILSTVIGQSLCNMHKHLGFNTISINHLGDWGTQFGKLAVAYEKWGKKPVAEHTLDDLLDLYVKFHVEAEKSATLEDEGRAAFAKLEKGSKSLREFWQQVIKITMKAIDEMYARLSVSFDHVHGESFYEDKMTPIIEEGKKKGVFKEGEQGAIIATFPEDTHLPPAIVLKGDGSTIYLTRDLATARYRIDTWHPQAILYVVDVAQQLYFKQLFHTIGQLKWDVPQLEHVIIGRMRFADRSMSTRKGNILRLEHVLDEAVTRAEAIIKERGETIQTDSPEELAEMMGVGALVYGVLSQNRKMDMVFDWDKMLSFEGNSAPYLQYTHARARSVLRKAEVDAPAVPAQAETLSDKERQLIRMLMIFRDVIQGAASERLPHKLCNYLYELCQAYNAFYNTENILKSAETERQVRLALTHITAAVLKTGASLLTIRVPERM